MSAYAGPEIVNNGLVLCLDAGNARSYPGSGTAWTDLSGNGNNGTLINGANFSTSNGGIFALDGINDYIDIPINLSTTNYTVIGASRYTGSVNGRIFSAKNNNWLMGHYSDSVLSYYAEGWITFGGGSDTNWRIYSATGNISSDSYNFYVNGALNFGPNSGGSAGPNGFAIGSYGGTIEFSSAQVGFLLAYNRVLSAAEISQNFNALRGRFGL